MIDIISNRGDLLQKKGSCVEDRYFRVVHAVNNAMFDLFCEGPDAKSMKAAFADRLGKVYEERQVKSKKHRVDLVENLLTVCFHGTPNNAIVA